MTKFNPKTTKSISIFSSLIYGAFLSFVAPQSMAEEVVVEEVGVVPVIEVIPVVESSAKVEAIYRDLLKREIKDEMQQEKQIKRAQQRTQKAEHVAEQAKKRAKKASLEATYAKQSASNAQRQIKEAEQVRKFEKKVAFLQAMKKAEQEISNAVKLTTQQLGGVLHEYQDAGIHVQSIDLRITHFTADIINALMTNMKSPNIPMQVIFPVRGNKQDLQKLVQNLSSVQGINILPMSARFESTIATKRPDKNQNIILVCISARKYPESQLLMLRKETLGKAFTTDKFEVSFMLSPN